MNVKVISAHRIERKVPGMTTSRIDMRIDNEIKAAAEKAAALLGTKSLTEYIVRLIEKDARRVISEHESIVVKDDLFDRFMNACEAAEAPNQKLRDARDYAEERGIR
ncbi:MAG: DUF1778 domain-containing protein [Candidatus Thiodiazotropha endolucinida]